MLAMQYQRQSVPLFKELRPSLELVNARSPPNEIQSALWRRNMINHNIPKFQMKGTADVTTKFN